MRLSVVIPAYNEEQVLGTTIERIVVAFRQAEVDEQAWELIVCDNNSSDQTSAVARKHGAKVVREPLNQIARARNRGAEAAQGEWLLFVDADSYPPPELVTEVWELMGGQRCVGCGTTVEVRGGTLLNKLRMERLNPLFRAFGFCGGAFLLCRTEAFRAVGGFSLSLYALEEIEFVIRLRRWGRKRGQRFRVLHRHPVITSGRKWEYGLGSFVRLFTSNLAALVLLALHLVLPRAWVPRPPLWVLRYWYGRHS